MFLNIFVRTECSRVGESEMPTRIESAEAKFVDSACLFLFLF